MDGEIVVNIPRRFFGTRKQGFRFSMETWMCLSDYTQLALNEFGKLSNDRFVPALYYQAAKIYDLSHKKWARYTEADVKKWIERMTVADANAVLNTMIQSKVGGESISELIMEAVQGKKKRYGRAKSGITPSDTSE